MKHGFSIDIGGPADVLALQQRLRADGHDPGPADGIWGPKTTAAIQRLLLTYIGREQAKDPAWLAVARRELGVSEIAGGQHNPRILEYHLTAGGARTDEVPWCSAFVNWCMAGYKGTHSAAARSWLSWGVPADNYPVGGIAVFRRGTQPWQGHVGFIVGQDEQGRLLILGGNQGNRVSIQPFPVRDLLGVRWPAGMGWTG